MKFSVLVIFLLSSQSAASVLEEVVVTATRFDQQTQSLTTNIAAIDNVQLERANHTHPNEVFQRVAGVWISRGNGQESLTSIRSPVLTGAGACGAFLKAQDGIPLQASGFCNVNELFGAQSETATRIEVIKGPGSALHGSNAMHGLINIITPSISANGDSRVHFEGGPHDYYRLKINHQQDFWRLDMSTTNDAGYKNDSGFNQQKATFKLAGNLGSFDTITAISITNLDQETAGFIQGPLAYKSAQRKRDNPNPEAFRDATTFRVHSRLNRQLASGSVLILTPYFRRIEMDFLQHFLPGQALEENGHTSFGLQTFWRNVNGEVMGFDLEQTSGYLRESQVKPTIGSSFLVATIPQGRHYDYRVDATSVAAFVHKNHELSPRTNLVLGARYEIISYDYHNKMRSGRTREDGTACGFGGCRFSRPIDRTDSFINFSPKVGITYHLSEKHQLYTRLAQGFRAPQTTELYRLQSGQSIAQIDSEALVSLELGVRGDNNFFSYDLSTYTMRKNNVIFRNTERINVDNGKTRHAGIELSLSNSFSKQVSAGLNFSLANHEYANNPTLVTSSIKSNEIDTAPRLAGSANLNWHIHENLNVEIEWVHVGKYYTDPQNTAKYEGHDLLNLRANLAMSFRWSLTARLINLTDRDYAERADFSFGNHRYFVGDPRSLYIGLRVSL